LPNEFGVSKRKFEFYFGTKIIAMQQVLIQENRKGFKAGLIG
jgi:hypothetical protein